MANVRITVLEQQVKQLEVDKIELIRSTSTEIERLRQIIRTLTNPEATNINDLLVYTPLSELEKNKLSSNNIIKQQPKQQLINDNNNRDIKIETWNDNNNNNNNNNNLGSLIENESYEYNNMSEYKPPKQINKKEETEQKTHRSEESIFRLNTKRMSYKGFEFGDFGFMTTDFDQLSRGHTQWVNQVMHHPVQNGIVITASDDWCVMFWRFKKALGNEELKQEKLNLKLKKDVENKNKNRTTGAGYFIDPKLQHICGEIGLLPVLKINTGLEVKGISMSSDATILACTCYDEEEDEGNPELQLYFDTEQHWTFKHTQFNPYYGNVTNRNKERDIIDQDFKNDSNYKEISDTETTERHGGRFIRRRIISLPFEPIPHCLSFTRDNKYVFVAMYSSITILKELNEELEEEYLGSDSIPESKWPDHPVSLCCINIYTSEIRECEKIWKYLADDEHVSCMSISPNGGRIAIGTSLGQLIVTGVLNLTNDFEDEEDFNPLLQKIWSSNDDDDDDIQKVNVNHNNNKEEDTDGSVTAIDWSPDSNWIICGHASGVIKFWKRNDKERRLSTQLNRTISTWMTVSKVKRKSKMFECKWYLEGLHIEAINSLSIKGSMMVSGADDGNVVIHDLLKTFIDDSPINYNSNSLQKNQKSDNSPITIGRINKIHGGRMVNSVCLTKNYSEQNLLLPSTGFFMVTSGADNIVHCVSLLDVCRQSIRQNYLNN